MNLNLIDFVRLTGSDIIDIAVVCLLLILFAFGHLALMAKSWRAPR
jgi:hypothetical protein